MDPQNDEAETTILPAEEGTPTETTPEVTPTETTPEGTPTESQSEPRTSKRTAS